MASKGNAGQTILSVVGVLVVVIVGWVILERLSLNGGAAQNGLSGGGSDVLGGLGQLLQSLFGLGQGSSRPGGGIGFSGNLGNSGNGFGSLNSGSNPVGDLISLVESQWGQDYPALSDALFGNDALNNIGSTDATIPYEPLQNYIPQMDPVYSPGDAGVGDLTGDGGDSGNYNYGSNSGSDSGSNYDGSGDGS